jgi:hypothetical protein
LPLTATPAAGRAKRGALSGVKSIAVTRRGFRRVVVVPPKAAVTAGLSQQSARKARDVAIAALWFRLK